VTETNFYEPRRELKVPIIQAITGGRPGRDEEPSIARARPLVFRSTASQRSSYSMASCDVNSVFQHLADVILILVLSAITSVIYQVGTHGTAVSVRLAVYVGLTAAIAFSLLVRLLTVQRGAAIVSSYDRMRDASLAWTLAFGTLTFGLFLAKAGADASRGMVLTLYFVGLPILALWRVFVPFGLAPLARHAGSAARECIVIGDQADPVVDKFAAALRANGHPAPKILKFRALCLASQWQAELENIVERATQAAHRSAPGEIYVCAGAVSADRLASIGRRLTILPRAIYIIPDAQTASLVRCKPVSLGKFVVLESRREPLGRGQRLIKRVMDIVISGVLLAVLLPFLLAVAALIKLDSKGPVLFRQTRNGYRGRPFNILKFRSMHVQENGPVVVQATRRDPRVTRIGRYLRKLSIDELPQLLNIFLGDMSLVGPRPHAQAHDELYARSIENYEIRQHVKPGLTGWAQVNGLRGETATINAMYQRIEYDLWYAVNASVLLDIEILARTAIEVVRSRNAY
jgi:undecaprenyl-phosphate galactose phosphotransferase/putative colanic acid biosynthesis UDP-glucose lipid carrier transferase